jgi:hypothetical protein
VRCSVRGELGGGVMVWRGGGGAALYRLGEEGWWAMRRGTVGRGAV